MRLITQDLRSAFRQLRRNPGFTAVAVATLTLGIGANIGVFSLVNAVLLRPLPFREPERLVWITNPATGEEGLPGMSRQATLRDWRAQNRSFADLGGYLAYSGRMNYTLTGQGDPARLQAVAVTGNFLRVLGVQIVRGRDFSDAECERNAPAALLLTDRCWRQRFLADPKIVGRSITLNGNPWTVVGVLPAGFDFSGVFTPGAKAADFLRPFPNMVDRAISPRRLMTRLLDLFSLLALLLASLGIYGVAAYSVSQRTREIGIRLALGASPAAVRRWVVGEGIKLALTGSAIGLAGSLALARVTQTLLFGVSATDVRTLAASIAVVAAAALLAYWLPACRAARVDPLVALRHE